jgi:hypothetical protein
MMMIFLLLQEQYKFLHDVAAASMTQYDEYANFQGRPAVNQEDVALTSETQYDEYVNFQG